jgi:hypothetical protein
MTRTLAPKIPLNDLAKSWGWKPARLYRLCAAGQIPHLVVGGRIYFEQPALDLWLAAQRKETAAERHERTRAEECSALWIDEWHQFR